MNPQFDIILYMNITLVILFNNIVYYTIINNNLFSYFYIVIINIWNKLLNNKLNN